MAVGGSGTWNPSGNSKFNSNGVYTIPKVTTELKEYCVSQKSYTHVINGEQEVIRAKISNGTPRFYVMALSDIDGKQDGITYAWYYSAYTNKMNDYARTTSVDFGKGASNTKNMIAKWNARAYGEQNTNSDHNDIWGQIQKEADRGWYVPSRAEWAAFGANLGINKSSYPGNGLSDWYWSSSQSGTNMACYYTNTYLYYDGTVNDISHVRLGTTF